MRRGVLPAHAALVCMLIAVCAGQITNRFSGWTDGATVTDNTLNAVQMFEIGKVWAAGMFDTVAYSLDGGFSWTQKPTRRADAQWKSVGVVKYCFDNPNPGPGRYNQYCENGRQVWVTGEYGWISKTTDWGETWQPQGGDASIGASSPRT